MVRSLKGEHMNNFEAIKIMTTEEMANFLCSGAGCFSCLYNQSEQCVVDVVCQKGIKLWLEHEWY